LTRPRQCWTRCSSSRPPNSSAAPCSMLEAEGEQQASIKRAQGTVQSIQLLSQALKERPDAREILHFLIAQQYVEANQKLSESNNSKVLFMDPKFLSEGLIDLMNSPVGPENGENLPKPPPNPRPPKKR